MQPLSIWRDLPYHTVIHIFIVAQSVLVGAGRWLDRLHDICHSMASHAVMSGVPVPVVSRLLGHSNVRMTLRYAHIADRDIEATAERMGESIGSLLGL